MTVGRRRARAAGAAAAAMLAGACSVYEREHYVGHGRYELACVDHGEQGVDRYVIEVGRADGEASLTVVTEYDREQPFLGLRVTDLDRGLAAPRGIEPYRGVLVTGTWPDSAGAAAGIADGDVVLRVGAEAIADRDQLARVEASLRGGVPVDVRLLRAHAELTVQVVPATMRQRVVDPQPIELERVEGGRPYAGLVLRGIPRAWCQRMFGADRNAVVIGAVDVGSPAWLAGCRGGDLVEAVDGGPVGTVADLVALLRARGPLGGTIALQVRRGGDDRHEAVIRLADYSGATQVWVPLLFWSRDAVRVDEWSIGPFGLLAGGTTTFVDDPPERAAPLRREFQALGGLLRVESGPTGRSLRLFWLLWIDL